MGNFVIIATVKNQMIGIFGPYNGFASVKNEMRNLRKQFEDNPEFFGLNISLKMQELFTNVTDL